MHQRCQQPKKRNPLFSAQMRRRGFALLDQQMWCWGCDVRTEGNLLRAYGFERRPPPAPNANSAYTYSASPGGSLTVWGFGLVYASDTLGSVLLLRTRFDPRYTPQAHPKPDAWSARQLPPFAHPATAEDNDRMRQLCVAALGQVATYERWVAQHAASDYRSSTVRAWPQRRALKGVPAAQMADAWDAFASQIAFTLTESIRTTP